MAKDTEALSQKLIVAATLGRIAEVKRLINEGADVNAQDFLKNTALIEAATNGRTNTVEMLIKYGADLNIQGLFNRTAIISAAWHYDNTAIMKNLIEGGAYINAKDEYDKTALMVAAENGNTEIVEMLIKAGADSSATNDQGKTALDMAKEGLGESKKGSDESQEKNKVKYQEIIEFLEHPPIPGHNTKKSYHKVSCPTNPSTTIEEPTIQTRV